MGLSNENKNRVRKSKNGKNGKRLSSYEIDQAYDDARVASEFTTFKRVKLNEKQEILYKGIQENIIISVAGPAGTAKTFTCCYAALEALKKNEIKKIYLVKPLETSGEQTGFLPGDLASKISPFLQSFLDNLHEMAMEKDVKAMLMSGVIEFVPLAFMRGRTLKDCYIIADELQNSDIKQLMTLITRLGKNGKIMLIGDQSQNDINKRYVAFDFFIEKILGVEEGIYHFKFDRSDIVRHPLLIKIIDKYEEAKNNNTLPETKNRN